MYRVVAFCDAPEVAVICSGWWRSSEGDQRGQVRWPPCRTDAAKNKLLECNAAPEVSWDVHQARTLFVTDDLKKAKNKERQAEVDSDLASESEKENQTHRNRRKNCRYEGYVQESYDDQSDEGSTLDPRIRARLAKPPSAPSFTIADTCSLPGPSADQHPEPAPEQSPSTPLGKRSQLRQVGSEMRTPTSAGSSAPVQASVGSEVKSCDGCVTNGKVNRQLLLMMTKVMKTMEGIQNAVRQNTATLQSLESRAGSERPRMQATLRSMEELDALNVKLKDRSNFNNLVDQLTGWCSMAESDLDRNVRAVMRATVAPCLAEQLSLKGRNSKRAMEGTELHEAICAVLRRCGGADRQKVGTFIGKWLSGSRDRNGKRLQRAKNGAAETGATAESAQPAAALSPAVTASDQEAVLQQQQQEEDGVATVLELAALQEEEELPLDMF